MINSTVYKQLLTSNGKLTNMIDHGHEADSWVDVGDVGRSPRQPVHYKLDDVFSYVTLMGARYWLVAHRTEGRAG